MVPIKLPSNCFKIMSTTLKKSLGPGLLMAAAAIGVSHLVQSASTGAEFGYALVWAVVLANLFKYPFFQIERFVASPLPRRPVRADFPRCFGVPLIVGYT